jgi:hypothetical protein
MTNVTKGQFKCVQNFLDWEDRAEMLYGSTINAYKLYVNVILPTIREKALKVLLQEDKLSPVYNTILVNDCQLLLVNDGKNLAEDLSIIDITKAAHNELIKAGWFADFSSYLRQGDKERAGDTLSRVIFGHSGAIKLIQVQTV